MTILHENTSRNYIVNLDGNGNFGDSVAGVEDAANYLETPEQSHKTLSSLPGPEHFHKSEVRYAPSIELPTTGLSKEEWEESWEANRYYLDGLMATELEESDPWWALWHLLPRMEPKCPSNYTVGYCKNPTERHTHLKSCPCGREYCQTWCGGKNGVMHNRRKSVWFPKGQQMASMLYITFTIPEELAPLCMNPKVLSKLGREVKRALQYRGFKRGLRRWHFFGEEETAIKKGIWPPRPHPHLNVLVEGGWKEKSEFLAFTDDLRHAWEMILRHCVGKEAKELNIEVREPVVHVQYATCRNKKGIRKMVHFLSYILRPTFLDWRWNPVWAEELIGFKNTIQWGKWKDDPVWEVPEMPQGEEAEAPKPEAIKLQEGLCPCDYEIKWVKPITHRAAQEMFSEGQWEEFGTGHWVQNLARGPS